MCTILQIGEQALKKVPICDAYEVKGQAIALLSLVESRVRHAL